MIDFDIYIKPMIHITEYTDLDNINFVEESIYTDEYGQVIVGCVFG